MMKRIFCLLVLGLWGLLLMSNRLTFGEGPEKDKGATDRWQIQSDGAITWTIDGDKGLPHRDHIEMSGERVSTVLRYGLTEDSVFTAERSMVWPMLRTLPNDTHASLIRRFQFDIPGLVKINGAPLGKETVKSLTLKGMLSVSSEFERDGKPIIRLTRRFFPSTTRPLFCERYTFQNLTDGEITVEIPPYTVKDETEKGVNGSYITAVTLVGAGEFKLAPNGVIGCDVSIQAYGPEKGESEILPDFNAEEKNREAFVDEMWSKLIFESPDPILNTLFAFAKIRVSESIYRTAGGLMHGPGGESYYAAIWANDQAEYANPFFPYLGYQTGNEAALNSFLHFARFMNDKFEPIPSSIIAEGTSIWNGAGDRGDAAMVAYGACRYALVRGDREEAQKLWPLIEWCLEYCRLKLNDQGVVSSDCDELERRFPAGEANLCTSSLYYDALLSAAYLGRSLGKPKPPLNSYVQQAGELRKNIDAYFGHDVEGFNTYRYYDGNDVLRSWICMPLVVGITERSAETERALFSDRLWTQDGLLTQAGSKTFWDRSTLYALRGVFTAGATQEGLNYLTRYSRQRLLGDHVPYPIEAWPEGSQRHLAAESGLYCRIFTEGIFGIRPTGFNSFNMTPRLPKEWNSMSLKKIHGFGTIFDIDVIRQSDGLQITVTGSNGTRIYKIQEDETLFTVKP